MSKQQSYPIRCPQCGLEQVVELVDALDATANPSARDRLMANTLNRVACADCAYEFRVDKPLLYRDAARGFIVCLYPVGLDRIEEGTKYFRSVLDHLAAAWEGAIQKPSMHLVFSRVELIERIFLLEAGMDERLLEYVKYMIYSKNNAKVNARKQRILFNAQDSTEDQLCFVVQNVETNQFEGVLQYGREAYRALQEMFDRDEQTPSLMELFPGPYISARHLCME